MITIEHYLVVSIVLFCLGVLAVLIKRNAIGILMGVELILNATNLNFVAFSHLHPDRLDGQLFTLFIIVLAAAEAAVALALIFAIYHQFETINVDQVDRLKG